MTKPDVTKPDVTKPAATKPDGTNPAATNPIDVRGVLGGSRLLLQPQYAPDVAAYQAHVAGSSQVLLEVGFDHGRRLVSSARESPDWAFVGLEIRRQRVDEAQAWLERDSLDNLLVWRIDARTVLATVTPEASIDVLEVLIPTPWANEQAAKVLRRLVDARFVADVARVLKPGGLFHFETDVDWYAEAFDALLPANPALVRVPDAQGKAGRPPTRQLSRRQWKCQRDAIPVFVRWFRKAG